jgi:hypothetical protein
VSAPAAAPSRTTTTFQIFVQPVERKPDDKGPNVWLEAGTEQHTTSDGAKKAAAQRLADTADWKDHIIGGKGLKIAAVSTRMFKPSTAKVEPRPASVTLS